MRRIILTIAALLALCGAIGPAAPGNASHGAVHVAHIEQHGLGLIRPTARPPYRLPTIRAAAFPASVDLSAWTPAIADQGPIGDCVSYAEGWYERQWLLKHDWGQSFPAGGPAPAYLYAQQTHDPNAGSTFEGNYLTLEGGIATDAQYDSDHAPANTGSAAYTDAGLYNVVDDPTAADRANATQYPITGYSTIFIQGTGPVGTQQEDAIKATLASGRTLVIGISVYAEWEQYNGAGSIQPHAPGSFFYGNHAVFVDGYDAQGINGSNSWGPRWGDHGRFHLSWAFVNSSDLFAAYTATGPQPPAPTPTSLPTSTPVPTATPLPPAPTTTPTATSTPAPTATPAPRPHHGNPWRRVQRQRRIQWVSAGV